MACRRLARECGRRLATDNRQSIGHRDTGTTEKHTIVRVEPERHYPSDNHEVHEGHDVFKNDSVFRDLREAGQDRFASR